ncbi:serine/threonine-protein kinase [Streptomyces sp. DSM 44918]|uniref:Serine/threonine-protein kinase n=1 Tax=Streptomyces millisiae TaxID=3075542 RepID=A0ABU2LTP8_9ACTN|nr:serine/threonine-protein kinase [Streptomyces sp. DSM 44918]MDT0320978.1 serine/threonine-protein kinase [Streptomyces sp. DSM 44918]
MTGRSGQDSARFRELGDTDPRQVGTYRVHARLGSGGMGSVYLSYTPGGQPVALKVVRAEFADDPDFRRRFAREVTAARRVQGVYTVPVLDCDTEGPAPWLATAYVPGLPLGDVVGDHGPLPVETVLLLTAGVAEALQSIHAAGIVHRDLKPGNVLLSADGPKVIDFGIAQAADGTALTGTDVRVGTPAFMAPEQIMGTPAISAATDVFALGVVIHYAATGGHPFGEGSAHGLMYRIVQEPPELSGAPEALRGLIGACLAKDPGARPSPAQVIESCRLLSPGGTLRREGSWLPAEPAARVTGLRRTGLPTMPAMPPATTPATTPPPPGGGRRRLALLLTATAVVATTLGAVLGARLLGGDASDDAATGRDEPGATDGATLEEAGAGEGSSEEGGSESSGSAEAGEDDEPVRDGAYEVVRSEVALPIQAPRFREDAFVTILGDCNEADLTLLDLTTLTAQAGVRRGSVEYAEFESEASVRYMFCDDERVSEDGLWFDPDLFVGLTEDPDVNAQGCYDAAHEAPLPNPVPPDDILNDTSLRENTGICVEAPDGTLVLLWIDSVEPDPNNRDLRSYLTTATQWRPADS